VPVPAKGSVTTSVLIQRGKRWAGVETDETQGKTGKLQS
jgi:hypothetical protein